MLIDCFCQVRLICFIVYKPLNGVHDAQTNILLNGLEKIWHCIIVSVKKNLAHSSSVQTMKKQKDIPLILCDFEQDLTKSMMLYWLGQFFTIYDILKCLAPLHYNQPAQEVLLEPLSNLKTTKKFPELWAHPSSQSLWKFLGNFSRRKKMKSRAFIMPICI